LDQSEENQMNTTIRNSSGKGETPAECLSDDLVFRYTEGKVSAAEAEDVQDHLDSCETCLALVAALAKTPATPPSEAELVEFENAVTLHPEKQLATILDYVEKERRPEEFTGTSATISDLKTTPLDKITQRIGSYLDALRLQPAWGFAIVLIALLGLAGQGPFRTWRADVNTDGGMQDLRTIWTITDYDLRPPGNFPHSIFSEPHGTGPSQKTDETKEKFAKALFWDKKHQDALRGLAIYFYFTGDFTRADSVLDVLLVQDSLDYGAWNLRGLLAARQQDSTSAIAAFDMALHIQPNYLEAAYNRAVVLQQMGRLAEAKRAWQTYLEIDGQTDWAKAARQHLDEIVTP
jgi:tetratricopeptide (TPR) repeat protein